MAESTDHQVTVGPAVGAGQFWRHRKSGRLYEVRAVLFDNEGPVGGPIWKGSGPVVLYERLDHPLMYLRPFDEFTESFEPDGGIDG